MPREVQAVKHVTVAPCASIVEHVHATAPLIVHGTATHLFESGDGRQLAAFVAYTFTPDRG